MYICRRSADVYGKQQSKASLNSYRVSIYNYAHVTCANLGNAVAEHDQTHNASKQVSKPKTLFSSCLDLSVSADFLLILPIHHIVTNFERGLLLECIASLSTTNRLETATLLHNVETTYTHRLDIGIAREIEADNDDDVA